MTEKLCPFLKIASPGQIPPVLCLRTGRSILKATNGFIRFEECPFPDLTTEDCKLLPGTRVASEWESVDTGFDKIEKKTIILEKSL